MLCPEIFFFLLNDWLTRIAQQRPQAIPLRHVRTLEFDHNRVRRTEQPPFTEDVMKPD